MLIAYLDEFGHDGAFVSFEHKSYHQHPLFGYGGFIIPADNIRQFGAVFERTKERMFRKAIEADDAHPRRWEKKGNELFTAGAYAKHGRQTKRTMQMLSRVLARECKGHFFHYGEVKPVGTQKEVGITALERRASILVSAIHRLAENAIPRDEKLLILLDGVGTRERNDAITHMAGVMYSSHAPDYMARIVEVPVQIESVRYGCMQFADWYCALVSRVTANRFTGHPDFDWSVPLLEKVLFEHGQRIESRIWIPEEKTVVKEGLLCAEPGKLKLTTRKRPVTNAVRKLPNTVGAQAPALHDFYESLKRRQSE